MAWIMRGAQSVVFHYLSCAPCSGYTDGRRRHKAAKQARKLHEKLELEEPGAYRHPGPTMTNPFWDEEIAMGPRPLPRRARKTTTASSRNITTAGTQHSQLSRDGSSIDVEAAADMRLSNDTEEEDEHWNHKRYQREDEDLWGHQESSLSLPRKASNSLAGAIGFVSRRPETPKSEDYYTARAPPVNDLHPPVVSLLRSDPADNLWMLQPPPKAAIMAGKERASNRSRSGSGASSRVELRLQKQISMKQMQQKLERGETPELPSMSRTSSHSTLVTGQQRDRSRVPQARPPSSTSSRREKRRDTAIHLDALTTTRSSGDSKEARGRGSVVPLTINVPEIKVDRVRQRPCLSTVVSSRSGANDTSSTSDDEYEKPETGNENTITHTENATRTHRRHASAQISGPAFASTRQRAPLSSSDISSLNCLQELVSPNALLKSRFVSAPLVEAKIRLPPSDEDLKRTKRQEWSGGKFNVSRDCSADPPEIGSPLQRDPGSRWSISF